MSASLATDSSRPLRDWSFGLMWVLASAAGIGLGIGATYGLVFLVKALVPGVNEDTLGGGLIYILLASLLSFFQWLVLRGRIPSSARWFAATIAGLIIGFVFVPPVLRLIPALQGRDAQPLLALLVMIRYCWKIRDSISALAIRQQLPGQRTWKAVFVPVASPQTKPPAVSG